MRVPAGIGQEDSAMLIRYAAMRLVQLVPMVLVVTMVVFFVMMIVPGDPVMVMLGAVDGAQISQEVYDAMRMRLGLDQPLIVQYVNWLWNMLQGDLGSSITYRTPALEVILHRLVPTMYLMVGGIIMAVIIAVPAGVLAAIHNNTKWDNLATGFVIVGISVPTFWLALVTILIFAVYLGWLPSIGYTPPQKDFVDFLRHLALPLTVVALNIAATVLRFQRQDFLEQMHQDYVRTARAKGLSERVVLWKHVLRNSLITTLTVVGLQMAYLSGLITIVETVFNYPGIGYLLLNSIHTRDFVVVQGVVLFMVFLVIVVNLLVDILYAVLDPRIRYQ
ncbi:MAG: ABC transporter permease subunit [Deltaproteobacteria bacterium]|nr:ABC transporter permease subunit [Deltaproteobacteria bacterium]